MNSYNTKMMNDFVIIEPGKEVIQRTSSGLEFTESQTDDVRYKEGVVMKSPIEDLKVGDHIIYDRVAGHNFIFEDGVHRIIKLRDIVGVS